MLVVQKNWKCYYKYFAINLVLESRLVFPALLAQNLPPNFYPLNDYFVDFYNIKK